MKQNLRICIIGSQCTGKSTLSKILSEKLKLPYIQEVARIFDKSLFFNRTTKEFIELQQKIMQAQLEEEAKYKEYVSDRSTIDNLSYWLHNCSDNASDTENREYINTSIDNTKNYTHIFLLTPEFYPVADDFRDTNIVYQLQIAEIIHSILKLHNIKYHKLTGTTDNRIKKAMEILR